MEGRLTMNESVVAKPHAATSKEGPDPGTVLLRMAGAQEGPVLAGVKLDPSFALVLEHGSNGVVVTDNDGCIVWVNAAFCLRTGYGLKEVVGRNVRILRSGKHQPAFFRELWQTLLGGAVWEGEVINHDKNGKCYVQKQTITPIRDEQGSIRYFLAVQQDLRQRGQVLDILRESEQRFRVLVEATLEGVVIHNKGLIVNANTAAAEMLNRVPGDLVGRSLTEMVGPSLRGQFEERLANAVDHPFEINGLRGNGEQFVLQIRSRTVVQRGVTLGAVVMRDVTQARRQEAQTKLLDRKRAIEVERTRVARDMHDELGANLTRVKILAERLEQDAGNAHKTLEHARLIGLTARRLAVSLDELVWAVNPEKDRLENLGSYLISYAEEFLSVAGLRCRLEIPELLPDLSMPAPFRHRVFLVFKETLNNIVKHARATEVHIKLAVRRGILVIRVSDNGRGLPSRGLVEGNGLRQNRERLAECGGKWRVRSRPGQGCRVTILLRLLQM